MGKRSRGGADRTAAPDPEEEIAALESRIAAETPERGYAPPLTQQVAFRSLPLSNNTLLGLEQGFKSKKSFVTMTAIQHACIPHALAGRDILGAAKTGSGAHHDLSAGLLTGGKKEFRSEQSHVGRTNIIVATPGRLLQHLEQTPDFDTGGVQFLVLDEADRILDMGFRDELKRILEYLPNEKQTLLFSATQTKNVKDLATLSFRDKPEYLFVHSNKDSNSTPTPDNLKEQNVMVVPLEFKMDMIFSFLKSHLQKKTIVFLSSCAQVRLAHAIFCALQPGIPVLCLHGKIAQHRRTSIYFDFLHSAKAALFATDLAARGLDFPDVDWVLQADAPEDRDTYIHRVGRTARYKKGGRGLLLLRPLEEEGVTKLLTDIPLKKIHMNPNKAVSIRTKSASIVASNPHVHELAKKAFSSYLRSLQLMPNKEAFGNLQEVDVDGYAGSLGLAATPSVRFLKRGSESRDEYRTKKNVSKKLQRLKEQIKAEKLMKKIEKLNESDDKKKELLENMMNEKKKKGDEDDDSEGEDDLLVVKQKHAWDEDNVTNIPPPSPETTKQQPPPKRIRISGSSTSHNTKIRFDEEGNAQNPAKGIIKAKDFDSSAVAGANEEYVRQVRERLEETRELDQKEERERIREKHRKKKGNKVEDEEEEEEEGVTVTLGGNSDAMSVEGNESDSDSSGSSSDDSDSDNEVDLKAQEDIALALIRKTK